MAKKTSEEQAQRAADLAVIKETLERRAAIGKRIKETEGKEAYIVWLDAELDLRAKEGAEQRKLGSDAYLEWWLIQRETYDYDPDFERSPKKDYRITENYERACLYDHEFRLGF